MTAEKMLSSKELNAIEDRLGNDTPFAVGIKTVIVHEFVPAYVSLQHKYVGRKIPEDILGHAWDSFWSGGINGWLGISLAGEFFLNKVTGGNYDLPGWYIGASIAFAWPYLRAVSDLAFGNTFEKEKKELIERTERRLNST